MKILSWNVRGLGSEERRLVVKDFIRRHKVQLALIQESELKGMSDKIAREIWGSRAVRWLAVNSVGLTGGFLILWDARKFKVIDNWVGCFSMAVVIKHLDQGHQWLLSNVYGPIQ